MKIVQIKEIVKFWGDNLIARFRQFYYFYIDNLADVEHANKYKVDWVNSNKTNKQEIYYFYNLKQ